MDVLELPRPVINFLRTMAKEGCRYVLSWDIFGGTDTVTLTLTWKSNDDESQLSTYKLPQQPIYDDLYSRCDESISAAHISRRDMNHVSAASRARLSRGKSLEGNNLTLHKPIIFQPKQISSLERSTTVSRQKAEVDPIYTNLYDLKRATDPSPSNRLDKNFPSCFTNACHHRTKKPNETSNLRTTIQSAPVMSKISPVLPQVTHVPLETDDGDDDYNDDILDPWTKNFECSFAYDTKNTEQCNDHVNKTKNVSGKVKFKRKPEYF